MHNYYLNWSGSHLILRPALTVFTYDDVRIISYLITLILMFLLAILLAQNTNIWVAFTFIISMGAIRAPIYAVNIWQSMAPLIGMVASIIFLKLKPQHYGRIILFAVCGVAETFFDFPMPPIVTFLLPAFTMLLYDHFKSKKSSLSTFLNTIVCGAVWAAGVVLTWVIKWVIGFVADASVTNALISRIVGYGGTDALDFGPLLKMEINELFGLHKMIIIELSAVLFIFICAIYTVINYKFINKGDGWFYLCLLGLFLIPYVWYFFTRYHTFVHYDFVYRAQVVSVWILLAIPALIISKPTKKKRGVSEVEMNSEELML
jgi:hypothetical protein